MLTLTQTEAEDLIAMKKSFRTKRRAISMPDESNVWKLNSTESHEKFRLDISQRRFYLSQERHRYTKHQLRVRKRIVLVRLEVNGSPHTNPDGIKIGGTHIHIYREGFKAKWAYPVSPDDFRNLSNPEKLVYPISPTDFQDLSDLATVFRDFCTFCNIQNPPQFQFCLE